MNSTVLSQPLCRRASRPRVALARGPVRGGSGPAALPARRAARRATTGRRGEGEEGIALLLVLVVFVVLFLVVSQLSFSTKIEETIARSRASMVESELAQISIARYVLTLLLEDLINDPGAGGGAGAGAGAGEAGGPPAGAPPGGEEAREPDAAAGGGQFEQINAPGAGTAEWYEYLKENIFLENRRSMGNTEAKITIVDGERCFDLNYLFEYVRLPGEEVAAGAGGVPGEDELVDAVAGAADEEEATMRLRDRILQDARTRRQPAGGTGGAGDGAGDDPTPPGAAAGEAGAAEGPVSDYDLETEFIRPAEDRIQGTVEMLSRTLLMLFSMNEDNGYRYAQKYSPDIIARSIVDYVLDRRVGSLQNRIYLTSELLNIEGITPELFYGPVPAFREDEDIMVGQGFYLRRDEFGDIAPEYAYYQEDEIGQQMLQEQLTELEGQFGRFMDFPGLGLGPLQSNALTRGMNEPIVALDDNGEEFVIEPPLPLGLEDIFTTYSTGKINMNTAPVPVLFGLLMSLSEEDAAKVAHDIGYYRVKMQEYEEDEESVDEVESAATPDLGQPRRPVPEEEETEDPLAALGGFASYDPRLMEDFGSTYQNVETNYFTRLEQLELIDGVDGGPEDLLSSDAGVERVDEEDDTPLRKVIGDFQKVAVFGSTYFNVELKSKAQDSRAVKTSYMTVRRDPKRRMLEVLLWKELEK